MGLDFTGIQDEHGAAVFYIHDGSHKDETAFRTLAAEVSQRHTAQTTILSCDDTVAQKIIQFYALRGTHFVLIIRDDDQLYKVWSDGERFDAGQIVYALQQVG